MQKRGLSDIVATVLIILLAVAAIVIVWGFVRRAITEPGEIIGIETQFFEIGFNILPPASGTVLDPATGEVKFVLERKAGGGDIPGFLIVLEDSIGQTAPIDFSTTKLNELETKEITIAKGTGVDKHNLNSVVSVSVYPQLINNEGALVVSQAPSTTFQVPSGSTNIVGCTPACPVGETCIGNNLCVIEISTCQTLDTTGKTYLLKNNINLLQGVTECLIITADDITLDGNDKLVQGSSGPTTSGIKISQRSRITVKNIEIKEFGTGIYFDSVTDSVVEDSKITDNNVMGIVLGGTTGGNTFKNLEVCSNPTADFYCVNTNANTVTQPIKAETVTNYCNWLTQFSSCT